MKDRDSEAEKELSVSSIPAVDDSNYAVSEEHDLSGEAAGVIRGVSRSIVSRGPWIGRLPARASSSSSSSSSISRGILRRRVPARQVARVSDRVATGLDWYASALEATGPEENATKATTRRKEWIQRARSFGWSLFRNTLMGMAVFESYGYIISSLAPPSKEFESRSLNLEKIHHVSTVSGIDGGDLEEEEEDEDVAILFGEPDDYSRASLPAHIFGGSVAGSIHGIASSLMEGNPTSRSTVRYLAWNTFHHSLAHSMLFGSYEGIKRGILHVTEDEERSVSRAYHVLTFSVAGGLAGQVQHLASHYVEGGMGLANETLHVDWRQALRTAPSIRPLLWAFPPSAIGFVAFEYGKLFVS